MPLLTGELRQRVVQLLLDVPDLQSRVVRRSLVAGLPEAVRSCVGNGPSPAEVLNLVDVADSDAWWELSDGSFSVIRILENATFNFRGSHLEDDARALLDELKRRAVPAAVRTSPTREVRASGRPAGEDIERLHEALLSAFPNDDALRMLVRFRMNTNLDEVAAGENLRVRVFDLIAWAESEGRLEELVTVASAENPGNRQLREAAEAMRLVASSAASTSGDPAADSLLETESFRTGLALSEKTVCRVEAGVGGGLRFATGFLIGPSTVMTAHYAVTGTDDGSPPSFRFDYAISDGKTVRPGVVYVGEDDWLIDADPELNFALIRVSGAPGDDPEGDWHGASPRRWLRPATSHRFEAGDPLFMIQHPQAGPRQLAVNLNSVIGLSESGTQVSYRIDSLPGSGGAPCFNSNWELVALHLMGGTDDIRLGMPMSAIAARPSVQPYVTG